MTKVAINGFGRIGRLAFRQMLNMIYLSMKMIHMVKFVSPENIFQRSNPSTQKIVFCMQVLILKHYLQACV